MMSIGMSKANVYVETNTKVTFGHLANAAQPSGLPKAA